MKTTKYENAIIERIWHKNTVSYRRHQNGKQMLIDSFVKDPVGHFISTVAEYEEMMKEEVTYDTLELSESEYIFDAGDCTYRLTIK